MQAGKLWKRFLTIDHLEILYNDKIKKKPSVGMDKISPKKFEKDLSQNLEILIKKLQNGTYHFTHYKMLLFNKGPEKAPRMVCVPTLRDKLAATVINEILVGVYGEKSKTILPQIAINQIVSNIDDYTHFIKLDISKFYSSIPHDKLMNVLNKKIRKTEIKGTILNALKTEAIAYPIRKHGLKGEREKGIPEGLPFSNALANIYLSGIDEKYKNYPNILYVRYVDDILILLQGVDFGRIKKSISADLKKLGLKLNNKVDEGLIEKGFEYLGYKIDRKTVSVRESSVLKIEQSIEDLLSETKGTTNYQYIEWKINIKITGFILEKHKYGWMFFYSQISDEKLLFHLDDVVDKLLERYDLKGKIKVKRFVRTYHEIKKALHATRYIPNIDEFDVNDKRKILQEIYKLELTEKSDQFIEVNFRKIMRREIRDIEKDIQNIS